MSLECLLCDARISSGDHIETAQVRSNVRRFSDETFPVWRCPNCRSIHARDDVDIAHYYTAYPFHQSLPLNLPIRLIFRNLVKRLNRAGVKRSHSIIDYGCGSGVLVDYLRQQGYLRAVGYDAFSERFKDPAVLESRYDCIIAQDVVEHAPNPSELFDTFQTLTAPRGTIVIGTPNALGIDLQQVEQNVHYLHQPYHRHIFSKDAMILAVEEAGWELARYYPTAYANTLVPLLNVRTWLRYAQSVDNTVDLLFEPIHFGLRMLSPVICFHALFGGFFCPEVDVTYVFRSSRGGIRSRSASAL